MILITDPLVDDAIGILRREGQEVNVMAGISHEELVSLIDEYEAVIVKGRTTNVDRKVIESGAKGKLRVIGKCGVGVEKIDLEAARENRIIVVNSGF
jgi:D-3-phosphoglycerate dehydrogenase